MENKKVLKYANIFLIIACVGFSAVTYLENRNGTSELEGSLLDTIKLLGVIFYSTIVILAGLGLNSLGYLIFKRSNIRYGVIIVTTLLTIYTNAYLNSTVFSHTERPVEVVSGSEINELYTKQESRDSLTKVLNFSVESNLIYKQAKDSLAIWSKYLYRHYGDSLNLDSTVFLNTEGNKCILYYYTLCHAENECINEYINELYGVKIKGKWYFFRGGSLPQNKRIFGNIPFLNKEQFHILILKNSHGYLRKKGSGEWEINDSFFGDLTGGGICFECKTQEDFDKVYLEIVNKNWRHKDTTEYMPVK